MLFSGAIIQNDWFLKLNSHNIQSKLQTRTHAFHISVSVCAQTWINRTQKLYYKQVSDSQDKLILRMEAYTSSITLSFYSKYVILYLNEWIRNFWNMTNNLYRNLYLMWFVNLVNYIKFAMTFGLQQFSSWIFFCPTLIKGVKFLHLWSFRKWRKVLNKSYKKF